MTKIHELVNKLRTEYRTESVITDLSRTEESNKTIKDGKDRIVNWVNFSKIGIQSRIPKHLRERESNSKKKRDWNVNGKVGVVTSITLGHSLLPLLRQHGGVHKNGKSHMNDKHGKNGKQGKDGEDGKNKYINL